MTAESSGQVAQLVEQRTENPRVGSSILSLATSPLVLALLLGGCVGPETVGLFEDDCEATCRVTARQLDDCLEEQQWQTLDVDNANDFRNRCHDDWADMRQELSELERQQALESCESMLEWAREASCEELAGLYLP